MAAGRFPITAQYAVVQMLYWIGHCAVNTYAAVYLRSYGLGNTLIGILLAGVNGGALLLQSYLGGWLDRNPRIPVKHVGALLVIFSMGISLLLYLPGITPWQLGILYALMCVPYTAVQPLLNSMAFTYQNRGIIANYSLARACACGAYSLSSLLLGRLMDAAGPAILQKWFWASAFCTVTAFWWYGNRIPTSSSERSNEGAAPAKEVGYRAFLRENPGFFLYLVGAFMIFFFHYTQNTYMYSIVEHVGGGNQEYGIIFGITSICEIPASLLFNRLVKRIHNSIILRFSIISFLIKGCILLLARSVVGVYFAQSLQLFALGLYSVSSVHYAGHLATQEARVKAQTLLCDAMFLGACMGVLVSGYLLDMAGLYGMLRFGFVVLAFGSLFASSGVTICERSRS